MEIKPGIYPDLPSDEYHGDLGSYSKSSLVDYNVYPYFLKHRRANRPESRAFDLGKAAHTAILEPDKWESDVIVIPPAVLGKNGAKNTNAYRDWLAAQDKEKAIVSEMERDRTLWLRDSVHKNPGHSAARQYLTGGIAEVSAFWHERFVGDGIEEETGYHRMDSDQFGTDDIAHQLLMKCRPDYLPGVDLNRNPIVADLKTTAVKLTEKDLERQALNLHYHWSAALTLRGLTAATGKSHRIYVFIWVEINPPHEVYAQQASEEFIALGMKEIMPVMQRLAWSDKNDHWPGMPNRVGQLGIPGWKQKELYEHNELLAA